MKKSEKITTTIAIIIGYLIIAGLIQASFQANGGGGGSLIGLIFMGVIIAIRSIWKSKPNDEADTD